MNFAIRREVGFSTYQQDLKGLAGAPIELALPYKLEEYLRDRGNLGPLAALVRQAGISCPSVHAPQGRLTDDGFLSWALEAVRFAENIGAGVVVFHPESVRKDERTNMQILALRHLRELQRDTGLRIAVETFGSHKRVLLPEEIGEKGLWMVLDTSHVFEDRTRELVEHYHDRIAAVHLSEMRADETGEVRPHLPVQGFGFEVLGMLRAKAWNGTVTLEYLLEYHDRLLSDREALEALFS
jgi:sugar phosphate isomerase/epimerase